MSEVKEFVLKGIDSEAFATEMMLEAKRPIRVLLIQPPTRHAVRSYLAHVGNDEEDEGIGYKPPLGILYIGTLVKERSIHSVELIDAIAEQLDFEQVVERVKVSKPDVVGISAWTDFWYPAYETGRLIKEALPDVHLTYGGPHVAIYPEQTLNVPFIDSVVVGDGEVPFLYLCNLLANGVIDNSLPGLHFKEHGVKDQANTFFINKDLDSLPIPDRQLLPLKNYSSILGQDQLVTTMITSRGCPYRCTFCKLNFQKTLSRCADNILEEFRMLKALGIKEVEIYDDTFTWSGKRLEEICNKLIEADLGITWAVRDRVSSKAVDLDLFPLMKKAGCVRIHFGIESGVQRILDTVKKKITVEQARLAPKLAKEAGLTVLTYFMIGNPGETEEDIENTIKFALELDAHFCEFSITIPYAGTEMYDESLKNGVIPVDYWREYASAPTPDFVPPYLIENLVSRSTLVSLHNKAIRSFYFRPSYLVKSVAHVHSFKDFKRKAGMGLKLARAVLLPLRRQAAVHA